MEFCPLALNKDCSRAVTFDFSSNSSVSSVAGPPEGWKPESREKVCAWLRGDHDSDRSPHGDAANDSSAVSSEKVLDNRRTYEKEIAPSKNKVQCLLAYGEYSLFKHWKVLAEGDFIPFKPCAYKGEEQEDERRLSRKRRKVCVGEIRTLAITKNWLLIGRLYRLYQVEKDSIVPGGISLELRRIVPLRYLRVCIARPAARVIGVANQNGVLKQYQLLDKPGAMNDDPWIMWQQVINKLRPNLNDEVLYQTLNIFDTWQKQHSCRLTVHPGYENKSALTLSDWQVRLGEKEPEKCRCEGVKSSESNITGCVASVGDSIAMSASEVEGVVASFGSSRALSELEESSKAAPPVVARSSRESMRTESEVEGVLVSFGSDKVFSERGESSNGAPPVVARTSRESTQIQSDGVEAISEAFGVSGEMSEFGDSSDGLTATATTSYRSDMRQSSVIQGVMTSLGPSREMSESEEPSYGALAHTASRMSHTSSSSTASVSVPPPSAGRRRRSIKTIFRLGFLSSKTKLKTTQEDYTPSPDAGPPPHPNNRLIQRRVSRLEMNEPIEDIFSEVKFETMQKRPSSSEDVIEDDISDDDIIEDPEVILRSIIHSKNIDHNYENDFLVGDDARKPVSSSDSSDVTDPKVLERELLLPRLNCSGLAPNTVSDELVTSEGDLR